MSEVESMTFEQRVIQPASIHGYYGYPDHKHAADAHSWSSPTAFAATLAQHTALRPVSKQRRTSLLVDAAASHYAAPHHPDSLGHRHRQFRLTVNYAASGSDSLEHSTGPASITRCMEYSTCYRPPVSVGDFYEAQTNGSHDDYPPHAKRPSLFNPSPFYPLPSNASLFDYHSYHSYHNAQETGFERRDGGITVRDVSSMNAPFTEPRPAGLLKSDDEWKNINTMLNCILSMVEKTKRALAILQQRGIEPSESNDIKRAASEIMASAVRQTEERVAEVRRRAEDAVNQVKRQALLELQRAVGAAECKALELAAERGKPERRHSPPPDLSPGAVPQTNCCWNCGRKAQETCSGCNAARYCGAFCQHKDWENHHQVCSGRDQKPTTLLRTSPPTTTALSKTPRATTPITTQTIPTTTDNRLSLTTLNSAERLLTTNQDRNLTSNSERIALATLSSAQGLIGAIGGKK
ncbi:unnamed protein product [Euphydryas editha]|uniref:MYND-type domain-containing protein n=1 Tax=Euphydryas editha TaxID=104508 RepID=A0AAU9UHY2_EUPED|nr:unnamed protein product [Euphydryas editha]